MIWNAPIWLNELIISASNPFINILCIYTFIAMVLFLYRLIHFLILGRRNREYINTSFCKSNAYLIISIAVSVVILIIFYYPQQVIPDKYNYDALSIRVMAYIPDDYSKIKGVKQSGDILNIDKEKMKDIIRTLNDYKCRRSLDEGTIHGGFIEISMISFNKRGHARPMYIVISDNKLMRYSATNTDYVYTIIDENNTLKFRIINMLNSI